MLAALLVQLVRLIVAAPQADEAFEAHLNVLSCCCGVIVTVCGSNQTAHRHVVVAQTNLVDLMFCNQIYVIFLPLWALQRSAQLPRLVAGLTEAEDGNGRRLVHTLAKNMRCRELWVEEAIVWNDSYAV
jgi:hypothetical protein